MVRYFSHKNLNSYKQAILFYRLLQRGVCGISHGTPVYCMVQMNKEGLYLAAEGSLWLCPTDPSIPYATSHGISVHHKVYHNYCSSRCISLEMPYRTQRIPKVLLHNTGQVQLKIIFKKEIGNVGMATVPIILYRCWYNMQTMQG